MRTLIAMLVLSGCTHAQLVHETLRPNHGGVVKYVFAQGEGAKEADKIMARTCGGKNKFTITERGAGETEGGYVANSFGNTTVINRAGGSSYRWVKFECASEGDRWDE